MASAGVTFIDGTSKTLKKRNGDVYAVGLDPSGNVFVLLQKNLQLTSAASPPQVSGFVENASPYISAASRVAESWMRLDAAGVAERYGMHGRWFDNMRVNNRGMENGPTAISGALQSTYWPRYDRSERGIIGKYEASSVHERRIGNKTIVSFALTLTGYGPHAFRDTSFVTHVFDTPSVITNTFIVNNNQPSAMVLDLDYTGYPVTDLAQSEKFYTKIMKLGKPYTDDSWRGNWSNYTVFGIYTAIIEDDCVPIANHSNGYVSFWVRSAQVTYDYLKSHGSSFPLIPAINSKRGVEALPGYTQVTATDSEGNVVVFTEYSGRPR